MYNRRVGLLPCSTCTWSRERTVYNILCSAIHVYIMCVYMYTYVCDYYSIVSVHVLYVSVLPLSTVYTYMYAHRCYNTDQHCVSVLTVCVSQSSGRSARRPSYISIHVYTCYSEYLAGCSDPMEVQREREREGLPIILWGRFIRA